MAQKSKKVSESGKDSPDKSPPSGGESELAAALSSREQASEKNSSEGVLDSDQQKGKKKGEFVLVAICVVPLHKEEASFMLLYMPLSVSCTSECFVCLPWGCTFCLGHQCTNCRVGGSYGMV